MKDDRPGLLNIFLVFLKIGAVSFGGNVALVAGVKREIAEKRSWLSDKDILDLMVLGNIMPGPLATNVIFTCGRLMGGLPGAFTALFAVLLPSFVMMTVISALYFGFDKPLWVTHVMSGIIPCVAAVIAATAWNLGRKNITGVAEVFICVLAGAATLLFKDFYVTFIVVATSGLIGYWAFARKNAAKATDTVMSFSKRDAYFIPIIAAVVIAAVYLIPFSLGHLEGARKILVTFSSMSVTLFGGGYVFIPALEKVVVHQMHWISTRDFAEGIAMGQITPGPIMISAVFVGWKVGGFWGALSAMIGMFVPPAILMLSASQFISRLKNNPAVESVFRGVRPAVIGMIAASVWVVFRTGEISWLSLSVFLAAFALIIRFNPETIWLILGSGVAGYLLF